MIVILRNFVRFDAWCFSSLRYFAKYSSGFNMYPVKDPGQLLPPDKVKGMTKLDREKFSKCIVVPWLEISEKLVGVGVSVLKKYLLKFIQFKPLRATYELLDGEEVLSDFKETVSIGPTKRVFLNPTLVGTIEDIEDNVRNALLKKGIIPDLKYSKIVMKYENWKTDEILKAILPDDSFSSYSIIGHIVHVNLRDQLLPFRTVIGEVLLDKVNGAKTVVNKTDIIDNTFRNFKMEVLCGISNMVTRTKENGCIYELDFSSVYWNPRLSTEHERIVNKLNKGDILYDVFSGIGPFAIPAAKKKCFVLANDLNPDSFKWLNVNCKLNKVQHFIRTFNKDGKDFIKNDIKKNILRKLNDKNFRNSIHITMNLPALAIDFLPSFCGLLRGSTGQQFHFFPIVHIYCFVSGQSPERLAQKEVENKLSCNLDKNVIEIVFVRNVAPNKDMMRVSFTLSNDLLLRESANPAIEDTDAVGEPSCKKKCLGTEAYIA